MNLFKWNVSQWRTDAESETKFLPELLPRITQIIRTRCLISNSKFVPFSAVRSLLFFIFLSIMIISCQEQPEDSVGTLHGVWYFNSGGWEDYIVIDIMEKTILYYNNYKAEIVNSPDFKAANGVLIIKFTKYWETDWNTFETEETDKYNGKFGALYWKDLKSSSISMSDAYSGYTHTMFDSESQAKTNFTLDKTGDYISAWGGPYYK